MTCGRPLAALVAALAVAGQADAEEPLFDLRGVLGLDTALERNFDLDASERDRVGAAEAMARFGLTILPGRPVSGFIEIEALAEREWEKGEGRETERFVRLNQAFVRIDDVVSAGDLRLGRWLYRDEREWLIDENIDGARLSLEPGDWSIELLAGRVNAVRRDLLDRDSRGDSVWELGAIADRRIADDVRLGGYAIARIEDEDDRDRPLHVGLRAWGAPFGDGALSGLSFWADAGVVRGREDGRSLRGWGFDAGIVHSFDGLPGRPRIQLGYAFGSGDGSGSGADGAFRQTGLHSNEAERGSLAKYKYYGETLDPELSNVGILTVGVGATWRDTVSVDLLYHRYAKDRARGDLRDIALSADADRPFRDVGDAVDLVIGMRLGEDVEVEAAVGLFRPGRAFADRDDALFARVEVDFAF